MARYRKGASAELATLTDNTNVTEAAVKAISQRHAEPEWLRTERATQAKVREEQARLKEQRRAGE